VQEGKLSRASLHPWWDDFRDALVFVQEGKLAHASFRPQWNHVVRDVLVFCKREI
jgi:hypothetical protein